MGLRGLSNTSIRNMSKGREMTIPHNYCLHVSLLHTNIVIITGTSAKRRLTWGNGKDAKRGPADVGLHAKQMSLNKPEGQMLVMNF